MELQRTCLYCSAVIRAGRSDKKFCHAGCKDAYYNAIRSSEQNEISKIDGILKRNRRILKKFFESGRKVKIFSREEMLKAGFEFGFLTHVAVTKMKKNEITFCYDYGYRQATAEAYEVFRSFSTVLVKDGGVIKIDG